MSRAHVLLTVVAALFFASSSLAKAALPALAFQGGTPAEQAQVVKALNASSFNWSVIGVPVTVHIGDYEGDYATAGDVYFNASLLDSGQFAWGTVQHEFGHQVDFALLTDADRAQLQQALGVSTWFGDGTTTQLHSSLGAERFASELAWAYWQSPSNAMSPSSIGIESNGMPVAQFRALVTQLLGVAPATTTPAAVPAGTVLAAPKVTTTPKTASKKTTRR
ncbi:MAG TPA: hypothetical protein VGL76_04895 [Gaiellaceae bacterium]|jgi:hypothetical protein